MITWTPKGEGTPETQTKGLKVLGVRALGVWWLWVTVFRCSRGRILVSFAPWHVVPYQDWVTLQDQQSALLRHIAKRCNCHRTDACLQARSRRQSRPFRSNFGVRFSHKCRRGAAYQPFMMTCTAGVRWVLSYPYSLLPPTSGVGSCSGNIGSYATPARCSAERARTQNARRA